MLKFEPKNQNIFKSTRGQYFAFLKPLRFWNTKTGGCRGVALEKGYPAVCSFWRIIVVVFEKIAEYPKTPKPLFFHESEINKRSFKYQIVVLVPRFLHSVKSALLNIHFIDSSDALNSEHRIFDCKMLGTSWRSYYARKCWWHLCHIFGMDVAPSKNGAKIVDFWQAGTENGKKAL